MSASSLHQIIRSLDEHPGLTPEELSRLKRECSRDFGVPLPRNSVIIEEVRQQIKAGRLKNADGVLKALRVRKIRTLSGIAPIGVHTRPMGCPGKCVYCPTEARMPKSYLSNQPAVARAIANAFDPEAMVRSRLAQLETNGHSTDKNELIVMGGTWSAHPRPYQEEFIRRCFDGFNGLTSASLEEAQKMNETAAHRCVGLTLETRPDWIDEDEIRRWVRYGATRVELGVQTIFPDILELIRRGHGPDSVILATRLFKTAGYKITYHLMPGLPGSTPDRDVAMMEELFSNPDFQPDQIKIYPCIVNEHAQLYQWWKEGRFEPYDDAVLLDLLPRMKRLIPSYVRLSRLFRDIPGESIQAGSKITNIRQMIQGRMEEQEWQCRCLRCREPRDQEVLVSDAVLKTRVYPASGGTEMFLSFETEDERVCFAFLRLRFNSEEVSSSHFLPVLRAGAIVRELHTYGEMVPLDRHGKVQHMGFGRRLLNIAEELSAQQGARRLCVISGVGVREYYRKRGYRLEEGYMVKSLT